MFDLHNKVNAKLREQSRTDPNVRDPGVDPTWEDVKKKYLGMKLTKVLGQDFLFSIAVNYPDEPEPEQKSTQQSFLSALSEVYPSRSFSEYIQKSPATLDSRKEYMYWMYGLLFALSKDIRVKIPTYSQYYKKVMNYTSKCNKGKTCRNKSGGRRRTYRKYLL